MVFIEEIMEDDNNTDALQQHQTNFIDEVYRIGCGDYDDENYGWKHKKKVGNDEMSVLDRAVLDDVLSNINERKFDEIISRMKTDECEFLTSASSSSKIVHRDVSTRLERNSVSEVAEILRGAASSGSKTTDSLGMPAPPPYEISGLLDMPGMLGPLESAATYEEDEEEVMDGGVFDHTYRRKRHLSTTSVERTPMKLLRVKTEPADKENASPERQRGAWSSPAEIPLSILNNVWKMPNVAVKEEENVDEDGSTHDVIDELLAHWHEDDDDTPMMNGYLVTDDKPMATKVDSFIPDEDMFCVFHSDTLLPCFSDLSPKEPMANASGNGGRGGKRKPGRPARKSSQSSAASWNETYRRRPTLSSLSSSGGSFSTVTSDSCTGDDDDDDDTSEVSMNWFESVRKSTPRPFDSTLAHRRQRSTPGGKTSSSGRQERKSRTGVGRRGGGKTGRKSTETTAVMGGRSTWGEKMYSFDCHRLTTISCDSDDDAIVDVVTVPTSEEGTDENVDTKSYLTLIKAFHNYCATSSTSAAMQQQHRLAALQAARQHQQQQQQLRRARKFTLSCSSDKDRPIVAAEGFSLEFDEEEIQLETITLPPPPPPVQYRLAPAPVSTRPVGSRAARPTRGVPRGGAGSRGGATTQYRRGAATRGRRGGGAAARLSDEQRSKREALNDLERQRRREMTNELTALRVVVPAVRDNSRAAKVNILNSAAAHVLLLQRTLQRNEAICAKEYQTMIQLKARLKQLTE